MKERILWRGADERWEGLVWRGADEEEEMMLRGADKGRGWCVEGEIGRMG